MYRAGKGEKGQIQQPVTGNSTFDLHTFKYTFVLSARTLS